jgi:hypothetical protein
MAVPTPELRRASCLRIAENCIIFSGVPPILRTERMGLHEPPYPSRFHGHRRAIKRRLPAARVHHTWRNFGPSLSNEERPTT